MSYIEYDEGYINNIVSLANKTLGELAYNHSHSKAFGNDTNKYFDLWMEMFLYHKTLSNYVFEGTYNVITEEQRDLIIEEIIRISECSECKDYSGYFDNCLRDSEFCLLLEDNGFTVPLT